MKITDDMLSAQAAEARELWLQACTPDALPEHRFSRSSGVKCAVWCVHKSTLRRLTGASVLRAARPLFCCFPLRFRSAVR